MTPRNRAVGPALVRNGSSVRSSAIGGGVRDEYASHRLGAEGWYREQGALYRNPHAAAVREMVLVALAKWPEMFAGGGSLLDLCAGSGEVTAVIADALGVERVISADPFTGAAFLSAQGRSLDAEWSFAAIADGVLEERSFDVVICSYALHLCERSRLARICHELAQRADHLVVITPHKQPELRPGWGFALFEEHRDSKWRTRLRRYDSVHRLGVPLAE